MAKASSKNINRPEREIRLEKLQKLRDFGVSPYPYQVRRDLTIKIFRDTFTHIQKPVFLVGRVRSFRAHGKVSFANLEDMSGYVQLVFQWDKLGEENYLRLELLDVADFLEVSGTPYTTQRGELSLLVDSYRVIAKSLRPLPEKWAGLKDEEIRFRKRYLDILAHPELRDMFLKKAIFWNSMRHFLLNKGFIEVETPVLENTAGGADALPFITHHKALDIDLYLRISAGELWQKRLMVAGFEKTFEIGRVFRNEGLSPEHLQDYTQMEFYWAYATPEDGMTLVEEMYKFVVQETFGTTKFRCKDFEVDFSDTWEHFDYAEQIVQKTGIDIFHTSLSDVRKTLEKLNITFDSTLNEVRGIDLLWKYCRKQLAGPGFLVNVPVFMSPLAKRSPKNQELALQFQPIIAGSEVGKGYSELNDPLDQAKRFQEQAELRAAGDAEAQMPDADFVEALEHGMPPTTGFGVSERLFAFLVDKPVREAVIFPLLRPKKEVSETDHSSSSYA